MAVSWTFEIDLDRDNNWTDFTNRVVEGIPIKWSWGVAPYTHIWTDEVINVLIFNDDRAFSPDYPSGPYYGQLLPGRPCRLKADGEMQFLGLIEDYEAAPFLFGRRTTTLKIRSLKIDLDRTVYTARIWENKTLDAILAELIPMVRLPPTSYGVFLFDHPEWGFFDGPTFADPDDFLVADTGEITFAYTGDNLQGTTNARDLTNALDDDLKRSRQSFSIYQFMKDLAEAERGQVYINREGKFQFDNRSHWATNLTIAHTVNNDAQEMKVASPFKNTINRVTVTYQPRLVDDGYDNLLWQLASNVSVPANQSVTLRCVYADDSGGRFIQYPVGDNFVYTKSNGPVTVSIKESAQFALVTLTNEGVLTSVVSALKLYGQSVRAVNAGQVSVVEPSIGHELLITKAHEINIKAIDNYDDAQTIAGLELRRRAVYGTQIESVTYRGVPEDTSDAQLSVVVGDRIRVIDDQLYHDGLYHVAKIMQNLDVGSKELTTTWLLQPATIPAPLRDDDGEYLFDDDDNLLYEDW